jgi:hypothetical protein
MMIGFVAHCLQKEVRWFVERGVTVVSKKVQVFCYALLRVFSFFIL